jgi:hypothetical protein
MTLIRQIFTDFMNIKRAKISFYQFNQFNQCHQWLKYVIYGIAELETLNFYESLIINVLQTVDCRLNSVASYRTIYPTKPIPIIFET